MQDPLTTEERLNYYLTAPANAIALERGVNAQYSRGVFVKGKVEVEVGVIRDLFEKVKTNESLCEKIISCLDQVEKDLRQGNPTPEPEENPFFPIVEEILNYLDNSKV